MDNGGANQTTWGSENSCSHVFWHCASVVNIGIWRIPIYLFLQSIEDAVDLHLYVAARATRTRLYRSVIAELMRVALWSYGGCQ